MLLPRKEPLHPADGLAWLSGAVERWRGEARRRVAEFEALWREASDGRLFAELAFCLLTPQSPAVRCWAAVEELVDEGLLLSGSRREIAEVLRRSGVRFHRTKALNITLARRVFAPSGQPRVRVILQPFGTDAAAAREWLVQNVRGMGMKEASHFLRNVGLGLNLAVLDRHILRAMLRAGAVEELPRTLTRRRYLELERRFCELAARLGCTPAELDLAIWAEATGFVFK